MGKKMMTSFLLLALVLFILFFVFGMRFVEEFVVKSCGIYSESTCKNNGCKWNAAKKSCSGTTAR